MDYQRELELLATKLPDGAKVIVDLRTVCKTPRQSDWRWA
jgi:hypothetical protein